MNMFPCKSGCSSRGPCPTGPKRRESLKKLQIYDFLIKQVLNKCFVCVIYSQARVQGGAQGAWPPPPLQIEKQEEKKKKGHQSKFQDVLPIFCYFSTRKYHFLIYFLSWAPPPKKMKSKKKKKRFSDFGPPPPLTNSWTRA